MISVMGMTDIAGIDPPVAREYLHDFDTCSNDPSHDGWIYIGLYIVNQLK